MRFGASMPGRKCLSIARGMLASSEPASSFHMKRGSSGLGRETEARAGPGPALALEQEL